MLEDLDQVDWSKLKTLTGTAEQLPIALLELLSEDLDIVKSAYWKIDNHAVVQGVLFSSAVVLPRYLCEVVLKATHKNHAIDLIWQIGTGTSIDSELQPNCYSESVKAFEMLLEHPEIVSSDIYSVVKNELNDMLEIGADRSKST